MIAITACAAALAAVTVGLCSARNMKKHFVTDQYEIERSGSCRMALRSAAYFCRICMIMYGTDNEPLVAAIRAFAGCGADRRRYDGL